jgi:transcriptional regulator with XRE-family HTH domain
MSETAASCEPAPLIGEMKNVVFSKLEDYMKKHNLKKSDIALKAEVSRRSVTRLLQGQDRNYQPKVIENLYQILKDNKMQHTEAPESRDPMTEEAPMHEELVAKNQDLEKKLRRWKDIAHKTAEKVNNQLAISAGTKLYIRTYEEDRSYTGSLYQQTFDFILIEVYDKKNPKPFYYTIRKDDIKFIKTFYE